MQARVLPRIKGVGTVAQLKSDHQGFTQVKRERTHMGIRPGEHVVNVAITDREQLEALPQIGTCTAAFSADLDERSTSMGARPSAFSSTLIRFNALITPFVETPFTNALARGMLYR
ncbi:MAG: hypothetical protein CMB82_01100 [Flammeovirgaceae bacterium]|nr:hypothetical protein [Flammeovirgaceae bacterium]